MRSKVYCSVLSDYVNKQRASSPDVKSCNTLTYYGQQILSYKKSYIIYLPLFVSKHRPNFKYRNYCVVFRKYAPIDAIKRSFSLPFNNVIKICLHLFQNMEIIQYCIPYKSPKIIQIKVNHTYLFKSVYYNKKTNAYC